MTDTTSSAALSGNVLFYGKPEPLSVEAHGTLGVDPVEKPYGFVAKTNLVPLTVTEFAPAALSYPVIFIGDARMPVAVMALRGGENLFVSEAGEFRAAGMPADLAYTVAAGLYQYSLLDVIDIADISERDAAEVADTYFALMDYLGTDDLLTAVSGLPRDDRWHALARLAVRDDIYGSLRALCFDVLAAGEPDETGPQKIAEWEHGNGSRIERARRTLTEIRASDTRDLATLSVAARQIRSMTRTSGTGKSV